MPSKTISRLAFLSCQLRYIGVVHPPDLNFEMRFFLGFVIFINSPLTYKPIQFVSFVIIVINHN